MSLRSIYKSIKPEEIDKWDHYIDIYARHLPKGDSPLTILEIGVQNGGSLKMWRRYFGRRAKIIGVDIDAACKNLRVQGATILIGSQSDPSFLDQLISDHAPFDIVIDDGSHVGSDQIETFKRLIYHTLKLYVVEDTHTSYWPRWQPFSEGFIPFAKGLVDDLHSYFIAANSSEVYGENAWSSIVGRTDMGLRNILRSISFYDSMVFFEVGKNPPPLRHRRGLTSSE